MDVSVAICTWNRCRLLDDTLTSMRTLRIPEGIRWELVIVNNNSPDQTDKVIERHSDALPIRRVFEAKQGLSNARNCALDNSSGHLVISTDDDMHFDPDWLGAYVQAARRWPTASFFGGTIVPRYESSPPVWVTKNLGPLRGLLGFIDLGPVEARLPNVGAFGGNMAIRRNVCNEYRYDPDLGRRGDSLLAFEETQFFSRLRSTGHYGVWVPTAKVAHFIPTDRMTPRFVWNYAVGIGRSLARLETKADQSLRICGIPRWMLRQYVQRVIRYYWKVLTSASGWVVPLMEAGEIKGQMMESYSRYQDEMSRTEKPCEQSSSGDPTNKSLGSIGLASPDVIGMGTGATTNRVR